MSEPVTIGYRERLRRPEEFNGYLQEIYGSNLFGDALFRIVWGQTEVAEVAGADGYQDYLYAGGKPCWVLQRWNPPELFGPPELYYAQNMDLTTGLCITGEYPWRGRYENLIELGQNRVIEGKLQFETVALDWELIELLMPTLIDSLEMSEAEKEAAETAEAQRENDEVVGQIADELADLMPTFYGPTSYASQSVRTSVLQRKMEQLEKEWRRKYKGHRPMHGFYQGQGPI